MPSLNVPAFLVSQIPGGLKGPPALRYYKGQKSPGGIGLNNDQRKALLHLSNYGSIIIKPADKGGAIVIMDTDKYQSECLKTLSDPVFYEELPPAPNPSIIDKPLMKQSITTI